MECESLNQSAQAFMCNAIQNPISMDGLEMLTIVLLVAPIVIIQFFQLSLLIKAFNIILGR